ELCYEYTHRYDKIHMCQQHIIWLKENFPPIPSYGLTPMRTAMPDKYKDDDVVKSYRQYYNGDKTSFAKWSKRDIPYWYDVIVNKKQITLIKKLNGFKRVESKPTN